MAGENVYKPKEELEAEKKAQSQKSKPTKKVSVKNPISNLSDRFDKKKTKTITRNQRKYQIYRFIY